MLKYFGDVRCWVNSGKHLLALSFSEFDPKATSSTNPRGFERSAKARNEAHSASGRFRLKFSLAKTFLLKHLGSKAMKTASLDHPGRLCALVLTAIGPVLALVLGFAQGAVAQQNPVTAIDIALEPDATMMQHAKDANARLLKSFPKGFALDETHHPHVTMLQQFVRTDDLDKVFAAANAVLAKEKPTTWTLKAFKYYYIPAPPIGLAGIVVEFTALARSADRPPTRFH
jgi:hypothetical protein